MKASQIFIHLVLNFNDRHAHWSRRQQTVVAVRLCLAVRDSNRMCRLGFPGFCVK